MVITFAGHSFIPSKEQVKELVKEQLKIIIPNNIAVTCYFGGYGDFDYICACACKELKQDNSKIEIVYVAPYITLSEQAKIREMQKSGLCDASIYPPIEGVPPKAAILKRNEWMITKADWIISYVNCSYGGAYKSLQVAMRKEKNIINIWNCIQEKGFQK